MFTGIITHTGRLRERTTTAIEVGAPIFILKKLKLGDSIAVSGTCLTVTKKNKTSFEADVMPETWNKTMLGSLRTGALVNLELPLKAGDFLSGHVVQGHVDGTAKIVSIKKAGNSRIITLKTALTQHLSPKGSVTVSGIALTVINIKGVTFTVGIIPHTWNTTALHEAQVGDSVNIEVDHGLDPSQAQDDKKRIAIISSSFHKEMAQLLEMHCVNTLTKNGVPAKDIKLIAVPGALEIPLVAKKLAQQKKYDAIIALGIVHKGSTYHFEQVSNECVRGCMEVSREYEIPVIYEVLSVYNLRDARQRVSGARYNRGKDAAEAALKIIDILKHL